MALIVIMVLPAAITMIAIAAITPIMPLFGIGHGGSERQSGGSNGKRSVKRWTHDKGSFWVVVPTADCGGQCVSDIQVIAQPG